MTPTFVVSSEFITHTPESATAFVRRATLLNTDRRTRMADWTLDHGSIQRLIRK